jgi:hypothetical protein
MQARGVRIEICREPSIKDENRILNIGMIFFKKKINLEDTI